MYTPSWESIARTSGAARTLPRSRFPIFLVGLLLATAIPLSLLTYFSISIYTQDMTQRSEDGAVAVADDSATFIQQQVSNLMVHADSDGERQVAPALGDGSRAAVDLAGVNSGLSDIVTSKEGVDAAFVTDLSGQAIAIQPADPAVIGETFNGEDWFTGVLAQQAPYITGISTIRGTLDPDHIAIATPLRAGGKDDGKVIAYLASVYNLGFLQASVDDFQRRRGVDVTVMDHFGQVLVGFGASAKTHEYRLEDSPVRRAVEGTGSVVFVQSPGHPIFAAYAPAGDMHWAVEADVPADDLITDVANLRQTILVIAGILSAVLLGIVVLGQVLVVVHRRREESLLSRRIHSLGHLNEAARLVHSRAGQDVFDSIADNARELAVADVAALSVFALEDEPGRHLAAVSGDAALRPERLPDLDERAGHAAGDDHGIGPLLSVPLTGDGQFLGSLWVGRRAGSKPFDEEEEALVTQLAQTAVTAVNKLLRDRERDHLLDQLRKSNEQLVETSRLKSEFLANMSHELRTPLTAILGFSSLILDGGDGEVESDLADDIRQIHRSGSTLLGLVDEILDLSKIEAGMMKLEVGPVPMDGLIDGVIASLRPLAESRGLRLDSDLHDPDLVGLCDADRTRQVLTNLVANAIKFTNEGAVSVRAGVERGQAMVSVFDTGIGIPEEALDLIFEKFAQADGSTTRRFGGTGLGLSISRKLVELQGGQMGVESTVGVGSRFWFTLPLAPAAPDDIPERALNDAIVI